MTRIDELIAEFAPYGVKFEPLREVCTDFIVPMRDRPKSLEGDIPWCRIEDIEGLSLSGSRTGLGVSPTTVREMNLKIIPEGAVIASCSASLGRYAIVTQPLITNQTFIGLVCGPRLNNRYLLHLLFTKTGELRSASTTGTIAYVSRKKFEDLVVPVPPLAVQREIAQILDRFIELEAGLEAELEAELEARHVQYGHYFKRLLSFGPDEAEELTLGDIGRVAMCKRVFKSETSETGEIPFFKIGTFGGEPDAFISRELFESYRRKFSYPKPGDILISAAGTIGRTVQYNGEDAYFQDSNIVWLDHDESIVSNEYLKYWYRVAQWTTAGGTIKRLYNTNLLRATIHVPPHHVQARIVEILDQFDRVANDLSLGLPAELAARRKQYEYYRSKLLSFEEAAA